MQQRTAVFVVCLFATIALGTASIRPSLERLQQLVNEDEATIMSFVHFAEKYAKAYPTEEEMVYRLKVFKQRKAEAEKQDEESRRIGSTARFGVTKFSDLTIEEFKQRYLMTNMPPIPSEVLYPNNMLPINASLQAPRTFDWRSKGKVTHVYNQGQCGSCWAFSATENHESRFSIQHNTPIREYSVQQIIDCDEPFEHGCQGGWPYLAWEYIEHQGGQDELQCYPYEGRYSGACRYKPNCNGGKVTGWGWVGPHNEPGMATWLSENAPISICLDASQWPNYRGGIVMGSQCEKRVDHCVLVVGYDFASSSPYWIVRNSWGTDWGYDGYIYLAYDQNTCGMADYPATCST